MWMRRWKTAHFSDPATAAAATTSSGAASDPSERAWQKRFRASEKEKLGLQEEIDVLSARQTGLQSKYAALASEKQALEAA